MNNGDKIIDYLHHNNNNICDDCISMLLNVKPRQQVNQICNKLKSKNIVQRFNSECSKCKSIKIINCISIDNVVINNKPNKSEIRKNDLSKVKSYNLSDPREVNIKFIEADQDNIFAKYNKYLLNDILKKSKYDKYNEYITKKYSNYLNYNISEFLIKLKSINNSDYKLFLNSYGDLKYCRFKIDDIDVLNKKGIYIYKVDKEIVYIGRCLDNFEKRINTGYANISPKNCFLDGQSTNCRVNSFINSNRDKIKLFILEIDDIESIKKIEIDLINKYQPLWNIQGK